MFIKTAASFQPGARTLAGEYYTSSAIFAREQQVIFGRLWNCIGREGRIVQPGEYLVREVAGESVIVVRGRDRAIRPFFNVCRHRGTRLCSDEAGRFTRVIQCPYHAWTYTIEGQLVGAPHMQDVQGFDKAAYPLHAAAVAEFGGFVFVNIGESAPPFAPWFAPLIDRFRRLELESLETAHRAEYDIQANWKLVFQNYSECLHCPTIHPELASRIPYESGANDLIEGPFLGGYMQISTPHESVTVTGRSCAPPIAAGEDDRRRAYYYTVMPNLLLSIHPDYVNYYLVTPVAPDRTRVESEWLFRRGGAGDPGFNPEDAVAFWHRVNQQDWNIIERSQQGVSSRRYVPGPYSPRESISAAWDREYLRLMQQ